MCLITRSLVEDLLGRAQYHRSLKVNISSFKNAACNKKFPSTRTRWSADRYNTSTDLDSMFDETKFNFGIVVYNKEKISAIAINCN